MRFVVAAWSWYTKGRRLPTLIGKDVSGRRIPGGPYTGVQAVTAAAVPALMWWTRGLWAADLAGLAAFVVFVGVTVGSVKLVGKVDFASRNPLLLLGGYLRQTGRPAAGMLAGRKVSEPKPHRVTARLEVAHLVPTVVSTVSEHAADPSTIQPAQPIDVARGESDVVAVVKATTLRSEASDFPDEGATAASAVAGARHQAPGTVTEMAPTVAAALRPASTLAPDRRRTGLEAFLAGAAAARAASTDEDAA